MLPVLSLLLFSACHGDEDKCYTQLYHTAPLAPGLSAQDVEDLLYMGPTLIDEGCAKGVNFAVFSESAERIELLLFDEDRSERPIKRFPMTRVGDVWDVYVEGIGAGQLYGYVAWGPNWPYDAAWTCGQRDGFISDVDAQGNRFNPNKLLTDPYALSLSRDHDWGIGSAGTGESRRQDCTWDAAAKSIVATSKYSWSAAEDTWRENRKAEDFAGHGWNDLILYEVHAKGFTMNGMDGVDHPGSYRGLGEKASYFKELGVTGVELMPIHEKPLDGGYWGYNNINFFAPELGYSADYTYGGPPEAVIDEFKWMVDQLHQQGLEVILDVVYNHTGEGGLWRDKVYTDDTLLDADGMMDAYNLDTTEAATIYSMRGLDNNAWYALSTDKFGYWNNTGVGNQTRPNYTPMTKLIMDSLHYYVEEMHVDGFRFDLAPILGESDGNYNDWSSPNTSILQAIADDPILQEHNTRLIAEPWSAGGGYSSIGGFPVSSNKAGTGWGEWNASFRDWWRNIANNDGWVMNSAENGADGGSVITGTQLRYGWNGRKPYHATNFVTAHDGFTMYDLFSFNEKNNNCGPLNPVCCDDPTSAWCDTASGESNNRSRDWGDEEIKRQQMRNMFVGMAISYGTPMILGGDEWMRTQYGNNNAYSTSADNEWNWFRWGEWQAQDERWRMHDFVSKIMAYRLAHTAAFAPLEYDSGMPISWESASGGSANWGSRQLMIHYTDNGTGSPEILVLLNFERYNVDFTLPPGNWGRIADTQRYFDGDDYLSTSGGDLRQSANIDPTGATVVSGVYGVADSAIVILEQR